MKLFDSSKKSNYKEAPKIDNVNIVIIIIIIIIMFLLW
jgi:hypothetical protein